MSLAYRWCCRGVYLVALPGSGTKSDISFICTNSLRSSQISTIGILWSCRKWR